MISACPVDEGLGVGLLPKRFSAWVLPVQDLEAQHGTGKVGSSESDRNVTELMSILCSHIHRICFV